MPKPTTTRCPDCARPLEHWISGSTQGAYCPVCRRWDVVTTYWPPILADRTIYRVLVAPNAHPSVEQVRAVAGVSGKNFLWATRVLAGPFTALFAGRAEAVLPVLAALDGAGVAREVEPAFHWLAADAPEAVRAAGLRRCSS